MFSISGLLAFMGGSIVIIAVLSISVVAAAGLAVVITKLVKKHRQTKNKKQAINTKAKSEEKAESKQESKNKTDIDEHKDEVTSKKVAPKKVAPKKVAPKKVVPKKVAPEEDVSAEDLKADSKFKYVYSIKLDTGHESETTRMGWKTNDKTSAVASLMSRKNAYGIAYMNKNIKAISFQAKYPDKNGNVKTFTKSYDLYNDRETTIEAFKKDFETFTSTFKNEKVKDASNECDSNKKASTVVDNSEEVEMK